MVLDEMQIARCRQQAVLDLFFAVDYRTMAGTKHFSPLSGHFFQSLRILQSETLHLIRIAYIGRGPLKQITAAQYFTFRIVDPNRILGVTAAENDQKTLIVEQRFPGDL